MMDNIKDFNKLFHFWKTTWTNSNDKEKYDVTKFVRDGIVDKETWDNLDINRKILFILKEPNDEQGIKTINNDYDLCNELKDKQIKREFATWRNAFLWAYGLLNTTSEQIADFKEAEKASYDGNLNNIAVLNLKKSYGGSRSDMALIKQFAQSDKDLILKEIELINPDIIITANVMDIVETILPDGQLNKNLDFEDDFKYSDWINEWTIGDKSICIIRHYHPEFFGNGATGSLEDETKYNICCECFQKYLQLKNGYKG